MADDIDLRPVFPFYRVRFDDGATFDYCGDARRMREEVAKFSPADVAGYERFIEASRDIFRVGFEQMGHIPFDSFAGMMKVVPAIMKLQGWRSVYGMASRYVKDERLRTVMTFQSLLVGGNPFNTTAIYCLIAYLERRWGVHWPVGGTGQLIEGLAGLVRHQGGTLRCRAKVEQIRVQGGRATGVRLVGGEVIDADIVVSNCDSAHTYRHLVAPEHRKRWTDAKIERARYSMGLFVWYFGTRRQYPDVAHHTIALGPRYRGLVTDIFKRKHLADDFSLYLHRPTATDASMAPPGCDTFYALSPVPHQDSGIDWRERAEPYRRLIQDRLEATLLPGLSQSLATSRVTTPLDFQFRLSSLRGAGFGLEPVLTQSAWFRPHNRSEDIDRLYLVGAGTHPGAGIPGVLSSARVLDQVVPHGDALARRAAAAAA